MEDVLYDMPTYEIGVLLPDGHFHVQANIVHINCSVVLA